MLFISHQEDRITKQVAEGVMRLSLSFMADRHSGLEPHSVHEEESLRGLIVAINDARDETLDQLVIRSV